MDRPRATASLGSPERRAVAYKNAAAKKRQPLQKVFEGVGSSQSVGQSARRSGAAGLQAGLLGLPSSPAAAACHAPLRALELVSTVPLSIV